MRTLISCPPSPEGWSNRDTRRGLHLLLGMLKSCLWGRVNFLVVRSSSWHDAHDLRFWRAVFPLTPWVRIRGCIYWLAAVQVEPLPLPPPKAQSWQHCTFARRQQNTRSTARPGAEDQPLMHWSQVCDKSLISLPSMLGLLVWSGQEWDQQGQFDADGPNHFPPHSHWIPCCELCRSRGPSFFQSWWRREVHSLPGAAPDMLSEGMWCLGPSDSGWELYWRESRL